MNDTGRNLTDLNLTDLNRTELIGVALAALIIGGWILSLAGCLIEAEHLSTSGKVIALLCRTFLQTGLFIVAHDAMHGSLLPDHPRFNHGIGRFSLWLYGCLDYDRCLTNHRRHHSSPASVDDPDYHDGHSTNPFSWYIRFMAGYLHPQQLILLVGTWAGLGMTLRWAGAGSIASILLYWTVPLLLSSLQLFLFGTYLPHRGSLGAATDEPHHVRSWALPPLLSLVSCYHFGYHWEHHHYPHVPWHLLPRVHAMERSTRQHHAQR
ncbi:fatty acid desaturase [Cyanobium sp. Morenito 9A2]|uniref:fatty acid desaturase n=1 Tax=Cyanobium sp. Morenito 9A2 TaxID=2823718 RepID=UPI0020CF64B1|nr:fatty acid desaturase [Cyanobium sp. Morenito 9A2]MCP9849253.1 fatty acid desaturase [Cyanobium sp. Morenito 9A2]